MFCQILLTFLLINQSPELAAIDRYINLLGPVHTGVSVVNCRNGVEIYSHQSRYLFVPASIQKLISVAGGFILLGSEYRFQTNFYTDSVSGTNVYNLYVQGGADPSLDTNQIKQFTGVLTGQGITEVVGNIYIDPYGVDTTSLGSGWMWDEGYYSYSARISALTCQGNCVELQVNTSGGSINCSVEPNCAYTLLVDSFQYGSEHNPEISRIFENGINVILLKGTVNRSFNQKINLEKPHLYTGYLVREYLTRNNISCYGEVKERPVNLNAQLVHSIHSPPYYQLADSVLNFSINLASELIIRKIGTLRNTQGTAQDGLDNILQAFQSMGIETSNVKARDGSGLSRYNLVSPYFLTSLLEAMLSNNLCCEYFYRSLPIMGLEGTVSFRLREISNRNIRAKTGSLSGVSSLAGYVENIHGDTLAFAIIMNNYTGSTSRIRNIQDSIVYVLLNMEVPR